MSERKRRARAERGLPFEPRSQAPVLTTEQHREIVAQREIRLQVLRKGRYNSGQQRAYALMQPPKTEAEKLKLRRLKRKYDPGHECPSCGVLVCTWTSRESGYSTKRTLCGEPECLRLAKQKAAAIANRKRWGKA